MEKIFNALVESATLFFEEHGYLCLNLTVKRYGGCQSFGGINLGSRFQKTYKPDGGDTAFWYIKRVFDICGVDNLNEIPGRTIRIRLDDRDRIEAIGHIINEDWFSPKIDFKWEK